MAAKEEKEGPRVVVRVSPAAHELLEEIALEKDCSPGEAADYIIGVGHTRWKAVSKYGEKQKKDRKANPKPKAEKKPKAAKPKKAAVKKKAAAKKGGGRKKAAPAPASEPMLPAAEESPTLPGAPAGEPDDDFDVPSEPTEERFVESDDDFGDT